jgi:2-C-methyl-D-erythritol 4-phosphate cytidylyltransferase
MNNEVGIIIAAAGISARMGRDKLFLPLGGKPLLAWSVDACQSYADISQIVIVLHKSNIDKGQLLALTRNWSKVKQICPGGERRQDSVYAGLKCLSDCRWVLIHDGARPFLTSAIITDGLKAATETGAAVAAVPIKDTIKFCREDNIVISTPLRTNVWSVQTPQVFRFDIIYTAFKEISAEVTDEASLVEKLGSEVKLYMGSYQNIKITTPEDLSLARLIARELKKKCV